MLLLRPARLMVALLLTLPRQLNPPRILLVFVHSCLQLAINPPMGKFLVNMVPPVELA